jgi:uncharacterized protein (TIGR02757 family)
MERAIELVRLYERERTCLTALIKDDPVYFVHLYHTKEDIELAGFLSSQFAYGRIKGIKAFLGELFSRIGSPFLFLKQGDPATLDGLYYRFHTSRDLKMLFERLRYIYERFGSMENLLLTFQGKTMRETLSRLRAEIFKDGELSFFFPDPTPSNPLKRWNLYLRWMVRKDEIDMGIWTFLDKKDLCVPLDTHLFRIGRCLKWTKRGRPDFQASQEVTEALRAISPKDPLMLDFFLCHRVGIENRCPGEKTEGCKGCLVHEF